MRFTIVTFGSEGDTRPFVALACGLLARGHEVQLLAEASSLDVVRARGVSGLSLSGDVRATLPIGNAYCDLTMKDIRRVLKATQALVDSNTASWMKSIAEYAQASDAVMYAGLAYHHGKAVAEALGKPGIALWLQPVAPTREFSSWALPPMQLPAPLNRATYAVSVPWALKFIYGKRVQRARKELFGRGDGPAFRGRTLTLYGLSRHLLGQPADWPECHRICGHWPLSSPQWTAPGELLEYLGSGSPPVYVGFGGAAWLTGRRTFELVKAALADRRVVFSPGWSHIDPTTLPSNFFLLEHTPHSWLFPRVSIAIHHCGAGTTHAAASAGVPSVPLPLGADQLHWAKGLARAGVAPGYLARRKLSPEMLRGMIEFAEKDGVRQSARALADAMALEDGVNNAVVAIERHMGRL